MYTMGTDTVFQHLLYIGSWIADEYKAIKGLHLQNTPSVRFVYMLLIRN